ncbi:MAG: hypothetical protein IPJ88_16380 [Myxococcales bacterium]|nr:MAG: hypothetical protein IPJ88_16380 [Myxococcales bacterium]
MFVAFLVSGAGFVSFSYGKRQRRFPQIAVGLILMVYPYFVSNVAWSLLIAAALLALLWLAVRVGL